MKIAIYASGRKHSAENITELMKERESGLSVPIQMADPLSANWSGEYEREEANCLAHARRKFTDIENIYPSKCKVVLDAIGKVYKFESETKRMGALERLLYHQQKGLGRLQSQGGGRKINSKACSGLAQ